MQIYLPIAELSVNVFTILALGGATGVLSGMFGIGGGFLMTPLLIFIGVSPAVSVATSANQIIASSVSGFMTHWRKNNVDFKMGIYLLAGGAVGSTLGVGIFRWLQKLGQIDLIISVCYVVFLGTIGTLMAIESGRQLLGRSRKRIIERPSMQPASIFPVHFPRSQMTISGLLPIAIGVMVGVLVSLMGIGGGFFLIPAMIYVLRMPTTVVIGTSLFQIIFITANVTLLQAITTQTVDILLALLLLSGSVIGAQFGTRLGGKLQATQLRGLLAIIVLGVAIRLAWGLFLPPDNLYSVEAQ